MAGQFGGTPVLGAVRGAFGMWRAALPRIWTVIVACGLLAAGASFAMVRFAEANAPLYLLSQLLVFSIFAFAYGAQVAAALDIAQDPRRRVVDGLRVFAAMSVIAFFLFIVFFAAFIPAAIIMGMSLTAQDLAALQAAQGDADASLRLVGRMFAEHWAPMLALALVYAAIWMFLTSRLFLVAPASVVEERVRTFETWRWTKGDALRISAARVLLLAPALAALMIAQAAFGMALGAGALSPGAMQALMREAPLRYLAFLAPMQTLSLIVYSGLEAALSAYFYKGLKPAPASAAI